jgi:ferrochelatase
MANTCSYTSELRKACAAVAGSRPWRLVYQSRSGPPSQPWLEPDIGDALRARAAAGDRSPVVITPIGFLSDHIEVLWDLDTAARAVAEECGIPYFRAATAGTHPRFVRLLRDRIAAAQQDGVTTCATDCCPGLTRPRP